jgi:hypothetical protein
MPPSPVRKREFGGDLSPHVCALHSPRFNGTLGRTKTGVGRASAFVQPVLWMTGKPMGSDRRSKWFETKQGWRLRGAPSEPLTMG